MNPAGAALLGVLAAFQLQVAAPTPAPSYEAVVDGELAARAAAAIREAEGYDAGADRARRLYDESVAAREAAAAEKAKLEAQLAEASRLARGTIEARIAELAEQIRLASAREPRLVTERALYEEKAGSLRATAAALTHEAKRRDADRTANALPADADLGTLPDVRLAQARAFHERRLGRVPLQLAALDRELDAAKEQGARAAVVVRKDGVRASAAADQAMIARIAEELSYREGAKHDDAEIARRLEEAGRARAAERAEAEGTPRPVSTGPDEKDRFLDSVLAAQDAEVAAAEAAQERTRMLSRVLQWLVGVLAIGGMLAVVVVLVRRA